MAKSGWGSMAKGMAQSGLVVRAILKSGEHVEGWVDRGKTTDAILHLQSVTDTRNRHYVDFDEVAALSGHMKS